MKVLMINTEMARGGAAKMATTLARAINVPDNGFEATLAHCENNEYDLPFIGLKRPMAYYLNILQTRLYGNLHINDFGVATELLKLAEKVDIVHLHNLHGYYLNIENLLKGLTNKPVVWTWHDMWGATGRCGFSMDCIEWKNGCSKCEYMNYYPKVWFDNAKAEYRKKTELYSNFKNLHIVSPSEWLRQIAIARGFSSDNAHTISNPVDLSKFQPVNQNEARSKLNLSDARIALFVAHDCNDERKRYHDFEQVIKITKMKGVVVGVPPEKLDPDMIYLGKLTNPEHLKWAYSAADIFIITSKSDNYPNTVVESMACGTPVFGYAVGGIPSQMPDNWDGLVEFGDYSALSVKIDDFITNYKNIGELRERISDYAKTSWDSLFIASRYQQLYTNMLK
ncbi:hypothetical protein MNBD_GAMMA11-229 [hydrothermal vent metagenome]|uniref:Glycosyltransferase n=1 Tax=hydrothermal vent metagenome TaxID=652676 RepID=A0A3B0XHU7_9ZZZZ